MPPSSSSAHIRHVWRATLISALLNGFGSPLDAIMGSGLAGMPLWPSFASSAAGFALAGFILITEPWRSLLIYGGFGAALLLYRLRGLARERQVAETQADLTAARKSARLLLAVRDRSNTPLQVIAICGATIRARSPESRDTLDRLDRAVDELRTLNRALQRYESDLEWRPGDDAFDSAEELKN